MSITNYQKNLNRLRALAEPPEAFDHASTVFIVYGVESFPQLVHVQLNQYPEGFASREDPVLWGYSEWRRKCKYRTLGVRWSKFVNDRTEGQSTGGCYIFRHYEDAMNYIAGMFGIQKEFS